MWNSDEVHNLMWFLNLWLKSLQLQFKFSLIPTNSIDLIVLLETFKLFPFSG
jgi:hypothetical protein